MCRQLRQVGGYEVDVKTVGDAFMVSFPLPHRPWYFNAQLFLIDQEWPEEILGSENGREIRYAEGNAIYKGLSVRMGVR